MTKAVGYIRISTKDQSNFSLAGQEKYIRDYAARKGIELIEVFCDEGKSAKNFDRPDWRKLEAFIALHRTEINHVIVVKYDRFSRNVTEGLQKIQMLEKKYGIVILSVFEEMYVESGSPFFFKQRADMLVSAEFELHVIRDRTKFGNHQARLSGRFITTAPWGYRNARDEKNKPIIVVDETRRALVTEMFRMFASGATLQEVRIYARAHGYTNTGHNAVQRMLSSCVYAGMIDVPPYRNEPARRVKGLHEAIVGMDLWLQVQRRLLPSSKIRTKDNDIVPLRAEVRCHCGRPLTAGRSKGKSRYYWYYKCNSHPQTNIPAVHLHHQFDDLLGYLSLAPHHVEYMCTRVHTIFKERLEALQAENKQIRAEIQRIHTLLDSIEEKFIADQISSDTYRKLDARYRAQLIDLHNRLTDDTATQNTLVHTFEQQLPRLTNIRSLYHHAPLSDKKLLIRSVFNSGLSYYEGIYRTPSLHPVFRHNEQIMRQKGLLEILDNAEKRLEFVGSTRDGS